MTKRLIEAGTLAAEAPASDGSFRICLIEEGRGSTADYPREFFNEQNAAALAGVLSFPGHPIDLQRPENRDPMSFIGRIGEHVTVEEHDGKMGLWGRLHPVKTKPQIAEFLKENHDKLGISIYADSDGHVDSTTGRWVAESIDPTDAYRSVDVVIAPGRGGKFERLAESLRTLHEASVTTAGEEEDTKMDKELSDKLDKLTTAVEGLVSVKTAEAAAAAAAEAQAAVEKAVESRFANYDKAMGLLAEAKLTESQNKELRDLAAKGEDIAPKIESAKALLAEARTLLAAETDGDDNTGAHLGGGQKVVEASTKGFSVPGFGKVS
jgi:hypothetical protein